MCCTFLGKRGRASFRRTVWASCSNLLWCVVDPTHCPSQMKTKCFLGCCCCCFSIGLWRKLRNLLIVSEKSCPQSKAVVLGIFFKCGKTLENKFSILGDTMFSFKEWDVYKDTTNRAHKWKCKNPNSHFFLSVCVQIKQTDTTCLSASFRGVCRCIFELWTQTGCAFQFKFKSALLAWMLLL